jgi:hypothetical protein
MKLKAVHVIKCISKTTPSFCLAQFLLTFAVSLYIDLPQSCQTYIHASQDKDEILQSLESHGVVRFGLPPFIGGSWSYERFSDWSTERAQMDREWHPEHSLPAVLTAPGGAAITSDDVAYTSCRTEYGHGDGDVLNSSSATSSPTGGAASLVTTEGDGSKSGVFIKRDGMYQYLLNQAVKAIDQLPQDEKRRTSKRLRICLPKFGW